MFVYGMPGILEGLLSPYLHAAWGADEVIW
jgi:hypothetical protein